MKHPSDKSTSDMFGFYESKGHEMARLSSNRADRELGDWSTRAQNFLMQFAQENPYEFLVEDARAYAELRGLEPPPDSRAWGHIVQNAKRQQFLVACGFGMAKSSNGSPKRKWKLKGIA